MAARELGNVCVVLEESELYISNFILSDSFRWLVNYGRHAGISLIAVGRRTPELNIQFRAMASTIITFQQTEPRDIRNLVDYGFSESAIAALGEHQFLTIGETIDEIQKTVG